MVCRSDGKRTMGDDPALRPPRQGPTAADVLAELRSGIRQDEPAYVVLVRLLTLGGRVPFQQGAAALKVHDLAVLHQLLGDDSIRLRLTSGPRQYGELLVIQSVQGRVSFIDANGPDWPTDAWSIGRLALAPYMLERVAEEVLAWEIAERTEQAELDGILRRWADLGVLAARVREVADWVDRVETVLIYVGEETYSRSDAGTSTLLRDGLLTRLERSTLDTWTASERLFVASMHLLFATGRAIRFEEFNGRQLTATALRTWLVTMWRRYAYAIGAPIPANLAGHPMELLAKEVGELSEAVNRSPWIRFRRITGLTFTKTEVLAELPRPRRSHCTLPALIGQFAEQAAGYAPDPALPAERAMAQIVDAILTLPEDQARQGVERLLATIVYAAVVDLDADYAMSSAVRDISRLAPDQDSRLGSILCLRKPDFFCCVIPHPSRLSDRTEADISRVLWLVAQRMQYNRWHFVPGNFERAEVPRQRHYFFPPALPDLAEFSDLWHGGHVAAEVRNSVRAPGAQLWREALDVGGSAHRGCFDIRAVRMSDEPFRREHLWTAVRYSGLVDALWRGVAARVNDGSAVPSITAFDRGWYERARWTGIVGDAVTLVPPS